MKRVIALILAVMLILPVLAQPVLASDTVREYDEPAAENIELYAYSAILVDMETGKPLYEYNADEQHYPASCTKVMTAYLCLKYGNPDDEITVSSEAFSDLSDRASTGGLKVGETMKVHRLLQALLVVSASEAANVVGEYISGSHEEFVDLMNEEAQALGCVNTHFANCHGLPNSNHYTCARDLSLIAQQAMKYQEFRDIVGSAITTMEPTNKHPYTQTIKSTNGILPGSSYPEYDYPYAIGIKTGHTNAAGYCLVSAANKDGKEIMCVIMGTPSRESSFAQTLKLYDWAYENYEALTYGWDVEGPPTELDTDLETIPDEEDEPEIVSIYEETPAPSAAVLTPAAVPAEAPADSVQEPEAPERVGNSLSDLTWADLTGPLLPAFLCFIIVILLVIALIILICISVSRKKRRRKKKNKKK